MIFVVGFDPTLASRTWGTRGLFFLLLKMISRLCFDPTSQKRDVGHPGFAVRINFGLLKGVAMRYRYFCLLVMLTIIPLQVFASASPKAIAVLEQEQRWLNAATKGDANALATMLAENFVHINDRGELTYREGALVEVKKSKGRVEHRSEQTVDFAGDAAVVHGVSTVTLPGKTVLRLRYTDVYVKRGGHWLTVSAQETKMLRADTAN